MKAHNEKKSAILYDVIDAHSDFYQGHAEKNARSLMNVTFRLPSDELQAAFMKGAQAHELGNLAGHRSVGGIRASIYNAMPIEGVETLAAYMKDFVSKNG
jgi:phosphoserine aminotransferase